MKCHDHTTVNWVLSSFSITPQDNSPEKKESKLYEDYNEVWQKNGKIHGKSTQNCLFRELLLHVRTECHLWSSRETGNTWLHAEPKPSKGRAECGVHGILFWSTFYCHWIKTPPKPTFKTLCSYLFAVHVWLKIDVSLKALQRMREWTRGDLWVYSANFWAKKPPKDAPNRWT